LSPAEPEGEENGFRVVDVWESEESFNRFGESLIPILEGDRRGG
jgi:hypothetical protein